MNCGIIGLPNAGKSALFNLLTGGGAESSCYPFCTIEPNTGVAKLDDPRLNDLKRLYPSARVTPPAVTFLDVAGLAPGASSGEGLGNQFLSHIRTAEAVIHTVRAFESGRVPECEGSTGDIRGDIELLETELFLADLEIARRRVESGSGNRYWEDARDMLQRRQVPPPDEEGVLITPKPCIRVFNVNSGSAPPVCYTGKEVCIDVLYQLELLGLPETEREVFLNELPGHESGADTLLEKVLGILNRILFFTAAGGKEIRGHIIRDGATVYEAAGKVHTDMQKGFIRALVYNYADLANTGFDMSLLKKQGKIRTEGRDSPVRDGDIVEILFSR